VVDDVEEENKPKRGFSITLQEKDTNSRKEYNGGGGANCGEGVRGKGMSPVKQPGEKSKIQRHDPNWGEHGHGRRKKTMYPSATLVGRVTGGLRS